jgi:aldehyde:ferredoxin oxidoreductase
MLGANLLISDLAGLQKCIFEADDLGLDIISLGNVIGFLIECREKDMIDDSFTDGIHLEWGSVDATLAMIRKIGAKEGIGELASHGVRKLAGIIGKGSESFAIHVKGHELAAWNVHKRPDRYGISYTTSNRGACHLNGGDPTSQDSMALKDSLGACTFASGWYKEELEYRHFMTAITGVEWEEDDYRQAGERIYNLERMLNMREGFTRADDRLPERFFTDAYTSGPAEGAIVDRNEFEGMLDSYYDARGWDSLSGRPIEEKLTELGLDFLL